MKVGILYKLRGKQLSVSFIALICATLIIWAWENTPLVVTFLPPSKQFDLLSPAGLKYIHEQPSGKEDAYGMGSHRNKTDKVDQILVDPPRGSITTSSYEMTDQERNLTVVSMEMKGIHINHLCVVLVPVLIFPHEAFNKRIASMSNCMLLSKHLGDKYLVCNYAKGKWVADRRRALYSGFSCKQWLSGMWACRLMQRADFSYENFRWQPQYCEMPDFKGSKFLRRMQNKTIAFVGDSLGRQQFQSLMCMVTGGKKSPEVKDVGREYGLVKGHGSIRPDGWAYRFLSTNTTILYYWSATLCKLKPLKGSGPATSYAMHLDQPVMFLVNYFHRFDVLVLNTGHHWNRWKIRANRWEMYVGGKPNMNQKLAGMANAKNLTIYSVVKWLDSQLPRHPRLKAFFRTTSPRHFAGGDWNTGGTCADTIPLRLGSEVVQDGSSDTIAEGAVKGTGFKLLDITALSQLRGEGHISRYSAKSSEGIHDCLHWCLPGIPDTWNEILAAEL